MGKPSAPQAPDPAQTIAAQSAANTASAQQSAELNRADQITPYGSLTWQQVGTNPDGTPMWQQTVSLSPEQQQLYDLQTQGATQLGQTGLQMLNNIGGLYSHPMDTSNLPGIVSSTGNNGPIATGYGGYGNIQSHLGQSGPLQQTVGGNYQDAMKQAQDAAYYGQTQYLDPQFSQAHEALDNQLINQGITRGSEAYQTAQDNLARQQQAAYSNAAMAAVGAGNEEQQRLYGQALSSGQFYNSAQQQYFNQLMASGQFANAAEAQAYMQAQSNAQFQNQAQQQQYQQSLANAQLANQANAQQYQQDYATYMQPLNTYNALMSGAQVQNPNFTGYAQPNVATTDVAGITNTGYQNQMAGYNAAMQPWNNLFSLGGTLASAAIMA